MNGQQHIPEGSIVITPAEVYSKVNNLTDAVRDLIAENKTTEEKRTEDRTKVAALEARIETKADKADVEKLDGRLTAVERKLLFATGAAAAVGGGLGTWLPKLLGA